MESLEISNHNYFKIISIISRYISYKLIVFRFEKILQIIIVIVFQ